MTLATRWLVPKPFAGEASAIAALAFELQCPASLAALLVGRGVREVEAAQQFLKPQLRSLGCPLLLPDMEAAVEALLAAIDAGRRIVLYGDYDVDGVTSLALLTRFFRAYGVEVGHFLPSRLEEGYGLTVAGVERCLVECQPELLVAVDCGTSSLAEVALLAERGVEVIVLDHHECLPTLPQCAAVVNPKRPDAEADYRYLCSVGLAFKLAHAVLKKRPQSQLQSVKAAKIDLRDYLDLVALGTISDIVPLVEENRTLVRQGLVRLEKTLWKGLAAVMDVARVKWPMTPSDVGFQIGPRINAAGRLGSAEDALELLLTDDSNRARLLALELDRLNRERQQVEKQTYDEAEEQALKEWAAATEAEALGSAAPLGPIVVAGKGWHPGVLGIVASRLCRKFHRPAIAIGFDEAGDGKGSGRSVDGISLVEYLALSGEWLERHGGHEMAAGLSLREESYDGFKAAFSRVMQERISPELLCPQVKLDGEAELAEIDLDYLAVHELLQPFGMGNPQPLFLLRGVRPLAEPTVMKEKHLRLLLGQGGDRHEAIYFNALPDDLPRPPWDVAFRISRNEWRERVTVQLLVQQIRSAE